MNNYLTDISNILVIGCGGAGLRAAIEVKKNNLSVKVLGKRPKSDSHTVLAAGGINASFGNLDHCDSWEEHFADTYLEGYKVGDPDLIEIMAKKAIDAVTEIDNWGADFEKLENGKFNQRYFGAHTYRRTCFSGDYTGQSILNTLLNKSKTYGIPIYDDEYVSDLLVEDKKCFGAISINLTSGEKTIHLADAVILCTGGHTKIWKISSSRKQENTGDGLFLGLKAGCQLIDMEMVQFHPTGMIMPEEMAGTLVTEAVRGEGGKLFNGLGERFMINYDHERMELSTRDKVAIANYTEIKEGRTSPNGGVFLDISHKDKDFIISKIPKIYRQFLEYQMLDISEKPMEVSPTAHYSMGGIRVNALDHSTNIKGLYAAGEVAGGLHGANRLGGNSLAEILIFGKIVGKASSDYSRNLKSQNRSQVVIKQAIENIEKTIKKGNQIAISLQNQLSQLMWNYCGVLKEEETLNQGLHKLKDLQNLSQDIDVRIYENNQQDLINTLNLQSSLITAEATIISAKNRKESRGAHQRSDFKETDNTKEFNNIINLQNHTLNLKEINTTPLRTDLKDFLLKKSRASEGKSKLLE
tara:strand:- start:3009 stop:4754 length:1746 start_codon:yes stop_codon:yes gene_type:complete